jgi:hypothetical protein
MELTGGRMMKTLAGKAIIPVAVTVTGFVIVCCILLYSVMKVDMTASAERQATVLAGTVVKSTRYAMLQSDDENLRDIIANISSQQGVEHVRIFNKKGLIEFSSDQAEMEQSRQFVNAKGRKVIAITAPIYNEPDCYNAACHFHPPGQKVLGTLDIGLSRQALQQSLATMRGRMFIFTIMILILTVGGVTALLVRSIFGPMRMIKNYCDALCRGDFKHGLPPFDGQMEELADSVQRVAAELKETRAALRDAEGRLPVLEQSEGDPKTTTPRTDEAAKQEKHAPTENRHGE